MTAATALQTLEEFSSTQWGLVTTAQAQMLGVSRMVLNRFASGDVVHRVRHGVYALPSAGADPFQDLHAAWLATDRHRGGEERAMANPDVVVSHLSAAAVHGLGDVIPMHHEFTSAARKQSAQSDVRFHRLTVLDEDVVLVGGLPVTSVVRTVADVASSAVDFDHLATMVRDGLSHPGVGYDDLADALKRSAGRFGHTDGASLIEACLAKAGDPPVAQDLLRNPVLERALSPALERTMERYASTIMPDALVQAVREALKLDPPAGSGPQIPSMFPAEVFQSELVRALRANAMAKQEIESGQESRSGNE